MDKSITKLRKWNLIAGGIDPNNDVIPASVGYGLEEGLQFAVSEILRLEARCKRLEEAGDEAICPLEYAARVRIWTEAKEAK